MKECTVLHDDPRPYRCAETKIDIRSVRREISREKEMKEEEWESGRDREERCDTMHSRTFERLLGLRLDQEAKYRRASCRCALSVHACL